MTQTKTVFLVVVTSAAVVLLAIGCYRIFAGKHGRSAVVTPPEFPVCTQIKKDNPPLYVSIVLTPIPPEYLNQLALCMRIPDAEQTVKKYTDMCKYETPCVLHEMAYYWFNVKPRRCWEELEWIVGKCLWYTRLAKKIHDLY